MMKVEILISCGATVGMLLQESVWGTGERFDFRKIMPFEASANYGDYVIVVDEAHAAAVLKRFPEIARVMR